MPFGLILSLLLHASLLGWAVFSMHANPPLSPDTPAIAADIITPSEFLRLKQGAENAKNLETKANDQPKPDDSKNDTPKPTNAPPPPPPPAEEQVAKTEPPPEPEPPEAAEPPPPPPPAEPVVKPKEEPPPPPPPPEPTPGPTPDEKKLLEQKLEEERRAEEAKKKAEAEAKKKAEEEARKKAEAEAKKKAEEQAKKKKAAELKKKKEEEAKKKAEAAKKQFDPSKIASLLEKSPEDSTPKALLDKDKRKKGQQASGSSATSEKFGKEAGTQTGTDTVLSAREQDLLKGMLKSQLNGCWRPPGTGGGSEVPVVELHWELNPDGTLAGEPRVTSAPPTTAGQVYAEAALRAVRMCSPFRLPPDKYEGGWRYIEWTFDPREML
ncbi:cell envelope integrity protein TolA [Hyphomicrobium sp.]|uniref:cell envelope integrity protein TolA n=1 Tax=Hyphomicrobium sp. TaxID=82 RepID=UPI002D76F835|nr:cell envelope integrity protein TolA [Hyphomicrobium sp.]HET6390056.1 cell envelope integrity protein TolA [Hyphomicrobium sp.]